MRGLLDTKVDFVLKNIFGFLKYPKVLKIGRAHV